MDDRTDPLKPVNATIKNILIIPIGIIDPGILDSISRVLRETLGCEITAAKSISLPEKTYNVLRTQFNSTKILKKLEAIKPDTFELLLGVVNEDLYVPELNFVFGEADVLTRVAVIALPRLRQEFYGLDPDKELFVLRASKEAIHELGHACGLVHCPDSRCVMHFSDSLSDTDRKELRFCAACRNKCSSVRSGEKQRGGCSEVTEAPGI